MVPKGTLAPSTEQRHLPFAICQGFISYDSTLCNNTDRTHTHLVFAFLCAFLRITRQRQAPWVSINDDMALKLFIVLQGTSLQPILLHIVPHKLDCPPCVLPHNSLCRFDIKGVVSVLVFRRALILPLSTNVLRKCSPRQERPTRI
jgi:hypothetical protein